MTDRSHVKNIPPLPIKVTTAAATTVPSPVAQDNPPVQMVFTSDMWSSFLLQQAQTQAQSIEIKSILTQNKILLAEVKILKEEVKALNDKDTLKTACMASMQEEISNLKNICKGRTADLKRVLASDKAKTHVIEGLTLSSSRKSEEINALIVKANRLKAQGEQKLAAKASGLDDISNLKMEIANLAQDSAKAAELFSARVASLQAKLETCEREASELCAIVTPLKSVNMGPLVASKHEVAMFNASSLVASWWHCKDVFLQLRKNLEFFNSSFADSSTLVLHGFPGGKPLTVEQVEAVMTVLSRHWNLVHKFCSQF
ncbi:hypothetical protein HDU79_010732 [Rhizoclosmatium sp. JEL0117]|nr:hypothetical protein HDU79_010732 [Rhizoclosmatium sp. JEL0117]